MNTKLDLHEHCTKRFLGVATGSAESENVLVVQFGKPDLGEAEEVPDPMESRIAVSEDRCRNGNEPGSLMIPNPVVRN